MLNEYSFDQRIPGQEVIIYRAGETKHQVKFWRILGYSFLSLSILGFWVILGPIFLAETSYRLGRNSLSSSTTEKNKISFFGHLLWLDKQNLSVPLDWDFALMIPKIGVNTIVSSNIDPYKQEEYNEVLKSSVAHAKGTSFPNQVGTTYIFGHSSNFLWDTVRQPPIFYLLKNLEKEDQIIVFYKGEKVVYRVVEKKITNPEEIPDFVSQTSERLLVLQTCWPPGTSWKRLFVLAKPI